MHNPSILLTFSIPTPISCGDIFAFSSDMKFLRKLISFILPHFWKEISFLNKFYFFMFALLLIGNTLHISDIQKFLQTGWIELSSTTPGDDSMAVRRIMGNILRDIQRMNSPQTTAPAQPCVACTTPVAATAQPAPAIRTENIRGEQCTARNSYLENQITSMRTNSPTIQQILANYESGQNRRVVRNCITTMMEMTFGASTPSFRQCGGNGNRPCLSNQYVNLIAGSFETALSCLQNDSSSNWNFQRNDLRSIMAMFNIESGFHPTLFSPTGAGGLGQLTQSAIREVNIAELNGMRQTLSNKGGICARLAQETLSRPMADSPAQRCERVSFSAGNPMKNIIYSLAYYARAKALLRPYFSQSTQGFSRLFGQAPCNQSDSSCVNSAPYQQWRQLQEDLLSRVAAWSHNTGPYGMRIKYDALATRWIRTGRVLTAGSGRNSMEAFLNELSPLQPTNEMRSYYSRLQQKMNRIESSAGEGGSCVR